MRTPKARCIVCGMHREIDHREEGGCVCVRCQDTIEGKREPELCRLLDCPADQIKYS